MDHITLPSVSGDTTMERALQILKESGKSGLVADLSWRPAVIDVEDILSTWREIGGGSALARVVPSKRSIRLPTEEPADAVLGRDGMRQTTESVIDSEGADYAVTQVRAGVSEVITRSERLAATLRTPLAVCRCRADPNHVWLERDLATAGICNLDGAQVDCS